MPGPEGVESVSFAVFYLVLVAELFVKELGGSQQKGLLLDSSVCLECLGSLASWLPFCRQDV